MDQSPDNSDGDEGEQGRAGGGGFSPEVIRSYLSFAKRALAKRKLAIGLVFMVGATLSIATAKYFPRTYACETVMMAVYNGVLDSDRGPQPFAGADGLIMSHDNLENLIKDINLKKSYVERRPQLLGLKDRIFATAFGPMDDKVLTAVLIGTLSSKLTVKAERETLTIDVEWSDGKTAAEIAEASRKSFLRVRHSSEISAFQDKMAILDTHAVAMRSEITSLADQMKQSLSEKRAQLAAEAGPAAKSATPAKRAPAARVTRSTRPVTDEQLPELKQRLVALKDKLTAAESDRTGRVRTEEAKLDELKLRLTPSHPQVITQEERLGMVSQVSSELALLRSEVQDLESQIRQRDAMQKTGPLNVASASAEAVGSEPLPGEILGLLDERDADPALAAQMQGAVVRYGSLRDDIRGAKLALDTAQAAFNHRYEVTVPVEEPSKPTKPKVPVILGGGLLLSLLLALILPVLLELRRDLLVERWQVQHFQLPVLAELRLPERTKD